MKVVIGKLNLKLAPRIRIPPGRWPSRLRTGTEPPLQINNPSRAISRPIMTNSFPNGFILLASPCQGDALSLNTERGFGIPRAAATRGNDRKGARCSALSFSRAWLPRVKNPGLLLTRAQCTKNRQVPDRGEAIPAPQAWAR